MASPKEFWKRLAPILYRGPQQQQPTHTTKQQPAHQPSNNNDLDTVMGRIKNAARQTPPKLLHIRYGGQPRLVEPYEFRGDLVFMHCSLHNQIHSFKISKIEAIEVTNEPFEPRWPIKI